MAPPPNLGDATNNNDDDPLGGMDPMAWLESLAARQGANPDELTTAANLDIPELPPDTVVDEPGYTPGYDTGKTAAAAPAKAEQPAAPPPPPAPEPVASVASSDDPLGGMDPMAWLESLAKRQGANTDELTTTADIDIPELPPDTVVDEPGYTPGYDTGKTAAAAPAKAEQPAVPPPPPAAPEPVASVASGDDPLGGMDPMAWLESLAARQGANLDELTTEHNLDIPEMPADTVVDEPGYVPYDPFGGSGVSRQGEAAKASQPPIPPPAPEPAMAASDDPLGGMDALSWLEQLASQQDSEVLSFTDEFVVEESAEPSSVEDVGVGAAESSTDVLGGMDPMSWLENLASGQGAELDELIGSTSSGSSAPSDESEYSPFAATGHPAEAAMQPESALNWLEDLAKGEALPDFEAASQEAEERAPIDESGGMSNDINEVQAWLEAQARNLEQTRVELENVEFSGDLTPAEPASELPDWLQAAQPIAGSQQSATPSFSDEIATPIAPEDLPSWLLTPSEEPALDIAEDLVEAIRATGTMPAVPTVPTIDEPALSTDELQALTQPSSPEEVDSWAEALDEEYERKVAGDESVPDWYLEALQRAESQLPQHELPSSSAAPAAVPEPPAEPEVAPAVSEMPDWLQQMSPVEQPPEPLEGTVPDWLQQMAPSEQAAPAQPSAESTDWLQGEVEVDDFPTWLRPEPETPAEPPAPVAPPVQAAPVQQAPVTPPPPPVQPVVQAAPAPPPRPAPQAPRVSIPTGPAGPEHHGRLKQARDLVAQNQALASLEHYQALIDASQLLEEARGDLRDLVEKNPAEPKLRRLLGDTHMRLGDLQAALDTYRSALDQL
jgi:hypothetical protein